MSFLDVLGMSIGPELSSSEVARVRSVLCQAEKSEVEVLRARVADASRGE